ncbi:MAG: seg [Candidatus Parcubacteria bacterium]|nr:seg [Candidatus Parcubacteria bacterium]
MRFQVPQFIEVEDKIFGQLTLKQFIYLAGGGGLSFLIYTIVGNIFIAAIPILIVMAVVIALSFFKVNNRPFINTVEAAFKYWVGGKLFIWKKEDKPKPQTSQAALREARNFAGVMVPKISDSKLKELSWSLDIKEKP